MEAKRTTEKKLVNEYIEAREIPDFDAIAREHGMREAKWLAQGVKAFSLPWEASDEDVEFYNEHLRPAAREWLERVEREEEKKRSAPKPDYPQGRKLDCGCVVYYKSEVMHASLGVVCPRHYDDPRWSG